MAIGSERLYISIVTDAAKAGRDLKNISRDMGKTRTAAESMRRSFVKLNSALAIIGGATFFGGMIKDLVKTIDTYKELGGRLNLVVQDTVGLTRAQADLNDVAMRTYTAYDGVASLYAKMGLATQNLAIDHTQLLGITETVANTLRLSGASAQEAKSSMLQLSQAMASGVLAGDEYRSISENNVALLGLFAKAAGKTRGELKQMAADQQITTEKMVEWISMFQGEYSDLVKDLPITVGRAMTNLETAWQRFIVSANEATGATTLWAEALQGAANVLDTITSATSFVDELAATGKIGDAVSDLTEQVKAYQILEAQGVELTKDMKWRQQELIDVVVEYANIIGSRMIRIEESHTATKHAAADATHEMTEAQIRQIDALQKVRETLDPTIGIWARYGDMMDVVMAAVDALIISTEEALGLFDKLEGHRDRALGKQNRSVSSGSRSTGRSSGSSRDTKQEAIDAMNSLLASMDKVKAINLAFDEGIEIVDAYAMELNKAGVAGEEYTRALAKITEATAGLNKVKQEGLQALADEADAWKNLSEDAFKSFSDGFSTYIIDSISDGEASFADFVESVIKGIAKMALQMAMTKFMGPLFGFADGGVIGGGTRMMAKGGVINQPTLLAGGAAIGGEAGPEVVAPLKRGKDGRMGVGSAPSIINITTNNASVETEETINSDGSRVLELMVKGIMGKSLGDGSMDRIMRSNYGARRASFG